jgi:two-component system, LuxR family, response regulator FixJ
MSDEPTVYIVDDDQQARDSVAALVCSMGIPTRSFASAETFLAACDKDARGCLVTDVRLAGMSGLELQEELPRRNIPLPVIVLTAYPRTTTTVRAIKAGAVTLLEKPYNHDDLWDAIRKALTEDESRHARHQRRQAILARMALLTPAERAVMGLVIEGWPNKLIAKELGISLRTVESRRHQVLAKLEANSLADLIRLTLEIDADQDCP